MTNSSSRSPLPPIVGITWEPHEVEREALNGLPAWCVVPQEAVNDQPERESVDALVTLARHVSVGLLQQLPQLRLLHLPNHGTDGLQRPDLVAELDRRQIAVAAAAQAGLPIAEFVIMCLVALNRRLAITHAAMVQGSGERSLHLRRTRLDGAMGGELSGSRLLVIGYGALGTAIAHRAAAMGMRVTAVKRTPLTDLRREPIDACVGIDQLDEVLPEADHVVLCVPLNADTESLLDEVRLRALPLGAHVINVARGRVVDERALIELVREGHLGGAALDVWSVDEGAEQGLVPDPSWGSLNIIATPHYAASTREARLRSLQFIVANVRRMRDGELIENRVTLAD